jgi:hypothetical protein
MISTVEYAGMKSMSCTRQVHAVILHVVICIWPQGARNLGESERLLLSDQEQWSSTG